VKQEQTQLCPRYQLSAILTPQSHPNLDAAPLFYKQAQPLAQPNQATKLSVRENLSVAGVSAHDHFLDEVSIDFKCHLPTHPTDLSNTPNRTSQHPTDLQPPNTHTQQIFSQVFPDSSLAIFRLVKQTCSQNEPRNRYMIIHSGKTQHSFVPGYVAFSPRQPSES